MYGLRSSERELTGSRRTWTLRGSGLSSRVVGATTPAGPASLAATASDVAFTTPAAVLSEATGRTKDSAEVLSALAAVVRSDARLCLGCATINDSDIDIGTARPVGSGGSLRSTRALVPIAGARVEGAMGAAATGLSFLTSAETSAVLPRAGAAETLRAAVPRASDVGLKSCPATGATTPTPSSAAAIHSPRLVDQLSMRVWDLRATR